MLEKLQSLEKKYEDLNLQMSDPAILADQNTYKQLAKAHGELEPIVHKYREYREVLDQLEDAEVMLREPQEADFAEMLKEEIATLSANQEALEEELQVLLLPKDPNDEKNVIVEVRAGTGGGEAAVFAGTLFRM